MTTSLDSTPRRSFDERLGEAVHQAMWRRKTTQTDFAERVLGITQSALSQKLRGKRPFYAGELGVIAAALSVPATDLLPEVVIAPDGDDGGGASGAPTRARTWDLRISGPSQRPRIVRQIAAAA